MAVTRIRNNQVYDSDINAGVKLLPGSLTGNILAATVTFNSNITVTGNLTVTGNVTSVQSTNTYINDPLVIFNNGYTGSLTGYNIGILVNRNLSSLGSYGSVNTFFGWVENDAAFEAIATTDTGVGITSINNSGWANVKVGNLTGTGATLTGNLTGTSASFASVLSAGTASFASINNTPIGNATPSSGAFTTLTSSGTIIGSGNIVAHSGTASTSTTTGALIVEGGAGISGATYIGGLINVAGAATISGASTLNTASAGSLQALAIGNVTPGTGAFTSLSSSTTATLNTVTGASFQGIIGNATPAAGTFSTLTVNGSTTLNTVTAASINNTPIGNATPSTGAFTTLTASGTTTFNTPTTGSLQALAIGNVTPGTGAFTTLTWNTATGGGLQAVAIGNVTPGTGAFTTLTASGTTTFNTPTTGSLQALAIGNVTPGTGAFTTLTNSGVHTSNGNLVAASGTASSSTTTGALVVAGSGGAGIGGALYVGGAATISGATTLNTVTGGSFQGIIGNVTPAAGNFTTVTATNFASGNAVLSGGSINGMTIGATSASTGKFTTIQGTDTTNATSSATGALIIAGGGGIAKDLWVGGNIYAGNIIGTIQETITIQDSLVYFQAPSPYSTYNYDQGFFSDMTQAYYGHTGVVRNHNDNTWYFFSNVAPEPAANTVSWSNPGIAYDSVKAGALTLANSTASTSTSTGALVVTGGAGIGGALYVGGSVFSANSAVGFFSSINNTPIGSLTPSTGAFTTLSTTGAITSTGNLVAGSGTASTNTTTGALVVAGSGGAGIGGALNVGGAATISGAYTLNTGSVGSLQALAIGNVTPGTGAFTTLTASGTTTFNTPTTGSLQALAIGNVTPGTGAFTTLTSSTTYTLNTGTVGSLQGIIGNVTPAAGTFTTLTAQTSATLNTTTVASLQGPIGNATPNTGAFTTLTNSGVHTSNGNLVAASGTASTSTTTGALVVAGSGGAGVGGALYVGGVHINNGNVVAASGTVTNDNTTGALLVKGGTAVTGNINVGGQVFIGSSSQSSIIAQNALIAARGTSSTGAGTQYTQIGAINATNTGSTDFAAYGNNATSDLLHGFADMGFTGDAFNDPAYTITGKNDAYVFGSGANATVGGNLVLATDYTGGFNDIVFGVGSFFANSEVARFHGNTSNSGYLNLAYTTNPTGAITSNSGALRVQGGASFAGNVYHAGGAIFNGGQTANYDVVVKGKTDSTLIWARPSATYDQVLIGGSGTASTLQGGAKLQINSTDSLLLPVGTTAQRPYNAGYTDVQGMVRFNTTLGSFEFCSVSGSPGTWQQVTTSFTVITDQQFTGTGSQTEFTLSNVTTTSGTIVSINGVVQIPTLAYSTFTANSALVFTEAPASSDIIDVRVLTTTQTITAISSTNGYMGVTAENTGLTITAGASAATPVVTYIANGAAVCGVSNVSVASANTATTIDTIDNTSYRSAKYLVQITNGAKYQVMEAIVISDGTTATITSYGTLQTNGNLGILTATQSSTNTLVQFIAANASNNVRVKKDYMSI